MGFADESKRAWEEVTRVHTKLADWGVNSVRTVKYLGEEHLKLGVYSRKNNTQKATATIDKSYNLVIDDSDPLDVFLTVLTR